MLVSLCVMEKQGSFKLLRNLLGSIAGGLSSLASLPFAKRKTPEAPLLVQAAPPPPPFTGLDHGGDNLSKLYPDMELSESRKRMRLSLDGVLEERGECSKKSNDVTGLGEPSEEGSGETSDGCVTPVPFSGVSYGVGKTLNECDVTVFGSGASRRGSTILNNHDHSDDVTHGVSHVGSTPSRSDVASYGGNDTLHIPDGFDEKVVSEPDEMLHDLRDDSDDNLASFRRTLVARRMKQKKRLQDSMKEEEIPRKRVRFGNTALDISSDTQSSLTASVHGTGTWLKKCASSTKRKRADEAEDKNEKKLRALTLSEEPVHIEGKTSMVGMIGVSTRKRERADDEGSHLKSVDEELKLQKVVLIENLPLTASRKAISKEFSQFGVMESMQLRSVYFHDEKSRRKQTSSGKINKTPNSQNARIVYKDEHSAKAALAHNMKEFNGNFLRVVAACAHGTSKETASAALDDTWSIVVRNTPIDVKDEELFQLFGSSGSSKLDVKAVRVIRDPNTGFSKGTAHVFFKTEADITCLLSLRQTLKLRDRVLHVSRASGNTRMEQRLTPLRLAKRSINLEADKSVSHEKRVKLSLPHEVLTITKEQGRQTHTRIKKSNLESPKEHIGVYVSSSHVYTTRHVTASMGQSKNLEDLPETKRTRVENRQRGISRSKKIRRT